MRLWQPIRQSLYLLNPLKTRDMLSISHLAMQLFRRGTLLPSAVGGSALPHSVYVGQQGALIEMVRSVVPPLTNDRHKGQAGRLGVVGGSQEYTGAPYFAGISALKLGADLAHIFCMKEASIAIKSYSPELIVHPLLDDAAGIVEVCKWLPKLHSLIIGPGLGRDPKILDNVKDVIIKAKELEIPLVIDADGVFIVTQNPEVIKDYTRAILTPNVVEFERLFEAVCGKQPNTSEPVENVTKLSRALGHVTVVQKGPVDIISDGHNVLVCSTEGSARRCGGQGDLLSGSMGAFTHWAHSAVKQKTINKDLQMFGPTLCAAYAACVLTRECNHLAFKTNGRSMTTSDMITCIHQAFHRLFEH